MTGDWAIDPQEWHEGPCLVLWGADYIDGPSFTSADEVEAFIAEVRAAAEAMFGTADK